MVQWTTASCGPNRCTTSLPAVADSVLAVSSLEPLEHGEAVGSAPGVVRRHPLGLEAEQVACCPGVTAGPNFEARSIFGAAGARAVSDFVLGEVSVGSTLLQRGGQHHQHQGHTKGQRGTRCENNNSGPKIFIHPRNLESRGTSLERPWEISDSGFRCGLCEHSTVRGPVKYHCLRVNRSVFGLLLIK